MFLFVCSHTEDQHPHPTGKIGPTTSKDCLRVNSFEVKGQGDNEIKREGPGRGAVAIDNTAVFWELGSFLQEVQDIKKTTIKLGKGWMLLEMVHFNPRTALREYYTEIPQTNCVYTALLVLLCQLWPLTEVCLMCEMNIRIFEILRVLSIDDSQSPWVQCNKLSSASFSCRDIFITSWSFWVT